jgi:hypothetical protein
MVNYQSVRIFNRLATKSRSIWMHWISTFVVYRVEKKFSGVL